MPKEKKYNKTVALRLTDAEWEAVQHTVQAEGHKNPTDLFRSWLAPILSRIMNANG